MLRAVIASWFAVLFLVILPIVVLISTDGCTKSQGQAVSVVQSGMTPAEACIVGQLVEGVTDPLVILNACLGTTVDDLIAVITKLIVNAADASPASSASQRLAALRVRALGIKPPPK